MALLLAITSCATVPLGPPPPDPATLKSTAILKTMDWQKAGDETFTNLREYLMAPSTNPPGNERVAADLLVKLLAEDGIEAAIWPIASADENRVNVVARLKSEKPTEGPLCLVSHTDVVTAEEARWPKDRGPYMGTIAKDETGEDVLWGRGALDMKGMGMLEVQALRWLKRLAIPLKRDVILLAVADEEVGGKGMRDLVDNHWAELGCTHSINEGGMGVRGALFEGQTAFSISVGEKGVLWLRVKADGPPGHGSTPVEGRAPGKLLQAMERIAKRKDTPHIHPAVYELLGQAGHEAGGASGFILERPSLVDTFVTGKLLSKPLTRAIITNTVNLTGFSGAKEPNVVPGEVTAQYDCRLLPGTTGDDVINELRLLTGPIEGLTFEKIDERLANVSEWDDPLFHALAFHAVDVAHRNGEARAIAGPLLSPGFTDSVFLRAKGVRAYGFVPFSVSGDDMGTMHGDGEKISRSNVRRGLETLLRAVVDVSAQ